MAKFIEIDPSEWNENVFQSIGRDWMLVSAGEPGKMNTMTASWGGFGVLWNANVSYIFIRPTRYTYELIEQGKYYSLSFLDGGYRRAMQYCGTHSGRDEDKIKATDLTPVYDAQAPYFAESRYAFICRKMYFQDFDPTNFLDPTIAGHYKENDYHRMYVGEIVKILKRV